MLAYAPCDALLLAYTCFIKVLCLQAKPVCLVLNKQELLGDLSARDSVASYLSLDSLLSAVEQPMTVIRTSASDVSGLSNILAWMKQTLQLP